MVLATNNPYSKPMALSLEWLAPPFVPLSKTEVQIKVDASPIQTVTLNSNNAHITTPFNLPAGEHTISVKLVTPTAGHFLRVALRDDRGQPVPWNLKREGERLFQAATHHEPLIIHVEGPTMVRIDEWQSGTSTSSTMFVKPGWQELKLVPAQNQKEAYYRVFQKRILDQQSTLSPMAERPTINLQSQTPQPVDIPDLVELEKWRLDEDIYDGTWSIEGRHVVQRDGVDGPGANAKERFRQVSITKRTHDPENLVYEQWGVLLRDHNDGNNALGTWFEHRNLSPNNPVNWRVGLKGFMQEIPTKGLSASATLRGGASHIHHLGSKLDNLVNISAYGHIMSMKNDQGTTQGSVDNSVYSDYRSDHKYGVTLSNKLKFRPWMDTWLSAQIGVTSNEDFNILKPEQISARGQWDQLLNDARLSLRYNWKRYLADNDRDLAVNRYGPEIKIGWDYQDKLDNRLEWSLNLRREESTKENIGYIGLIWHFDGILLDDFPPGEAPFKSLRNASWSNNP